MRPESARHADRRAAVVKRWSKSAGPRQGSRAVKENCPGTLRGPCPAGVGVSSIMHALVSFVVQCVCQRRRARCGGCGTIRPVRGGTTASRLCGTCISPASLPHACRTGAESELAQPLGQAVGADRLAGLPAGEQPAGASLVAQCGVSPAGADGLEAELEPHVLLAGVDLVEVEAADRGGPLGVEESEHIGIRRFLPTSRFCRVPGTSGSITAMIPATIAVGSSSLRSGWPATRSSGLTVSSCSRRRAWCHRASVSMPVAQHRPPAVPASAR